MENRPAYEIHIVGDFEPILITQQQFDKMKPLLETERMITVGDDIISVASIRTIRKVKNVVF